MLALIYGSISRKHHGDLSLCLHDQSARQWYYEDNVLDSNKSLLCRYFVLSSRPSPTAHLRFVTSPLNTPYFATPLHTSPLHHSHLATFPSIVRLTITNLMLRGRRYLSHHSTLLLFQRTKQHQTTDAHEDEKQETVSRCMTLIYTFENHIPYFGACALLDREIHQRWFQLTQPFQSLLKPRGPFTIN